MQSRKRTKFAMLAIVGLWVSSLVGCAGRYTGGGFIDSAAGAPQKATFGFDIVGIDLNGDQIPDVASGQFQYDDHGAGVKFHLDDLVPTGITIVYPSAGRAMTIYDGSYTSKDGDGDAWVAVSANNDFFQNPFTGQIFHNPDDHLFVVVNSGPYAGYSNDGTLQGGNIQWHELD
jgi:hypothetical protein